MRSPGKGTTAPAFHIYLQFMGYCVELPAGETVIGRDIACALRFNDSSVSRRHARLMREGDSIYAEDLGSTNGTWLNARVLDRRTELHDGDDLDVGAYALRLIIVDAATDDLTTRKVASLSEIGAIGREHRTATPRRSTVSSRAQRPTDAHPTDRPAERRGHHRQALELRLVYASSELEIEASTRDISPSGVFVCSHVLDPVGTRCELTILIDGGPALRVSGIVRRVVEHDGFRTDPVGLGIEFVELGAAERDWLEIAIKRMIDTVGFAGTVDKS